MLMSSSIWCPNHNGDESTHPRLEKDGFYICGDCDFKIVRKVEIGHCVACNKYIPNKWSCENCGQKVCGRHMEKRSVHGFGIYGCPVCFGLSEGFNHERRGEKFRGDYSGLTFIWNGKWYDWDGNPDTCYYNERIPSMKKHAEKCRDDLFKYKNYHMLTDTHSFLKDFIDIEKAEKWLERYEEGLK